MHACGRSRHWRRWAWCTRRRPTPRRTRTRREARSGHAVRTGAPTHTTTRRPSHLARARAAAAAAAGTAPRRPRSAGDAAVGATEAVVAHAEGIAHTPRSEHCAGQRRSSPQSGPPQPASHTHATPRQAPWCDERHASPHLASIAQSVPSHPAATHAASTHRPRPEQSPAQRTSSTHAPAAPPNPLRTRSASRRTAVRSGRRLAAARSATHAQVEKPLVRHALLAHARAAHPPRRRAGVGGRLCPAARSRPARARPRPRAPAPPAPAAPAASLRACVTSRSTPTWKALGRGPPSARPTPSGAIASMPLRPGVPSSRRSTRTAPEHRPSRSVPPCTTTRRCEPRRPRTPPTLCHSAHLQPPPRRPPLALTAPPPPPTLSSHACQHRCRSHPPITRPPNAGP